jgi:hypothetical protein
MYVSDAQSDGRESTGFQGLSCDTPDVQQFQKSLAAIRAALELNPRTGYVKGSPPRRQLDDAFESVPPCSAQELAKQLLNGQGPLEKLFRYRLAAPTQQAMLNVLMRKAKEWLERKRAEIRRLEEEGRRRIEELVRRLCTNIREKEILIGEVCRRTGEGSDQCRKLRSEEFKAREELRMHGIRCP